MADLTSTQFFKVEAERPMSANEILKIAFEANKEKGYDPINQITGYLVSDDPTYITSHKDARKLVRKLERDEIIEELLKAYFKENGWN